MKINGVRTFLMQAGAAGGASFASSRNWLFVKVYTDEGITGVGEGGGWPREVETAVEDLATLLIGEDPRESSGCGRRCYVAQMGHGMTGTVGGGAIERHRDGAVGHQGQGARHAGLEAARRQVARARAASTATPTRRARR